MTTEPAPTRKPRFWVSRLAVLAIMGIWVVAGIAKIRDLPHFMDVIEKHRVIPTEYRTLGMMVPMVELMMALLLVFVIGSELRKAFGRTVLTMSLLMVVGFTVYLSMVPNAVLQESGCGCWGKNGTPIPIAFGMENSVRVTAMLTTGLLLVLHTVALAGPVVTMRRLRRHATPATPAVATA